MILEVALINSLDTFVLAEVESHSCLFLDKCYEAELEAHLLVLVVA